MHSAEPVPVGSTVVSTPIISDLSEVWQEMYYVDSQTTRSYLT